MISYSRTSYLVRCTKESYVKQRIGSENILQPPNLIVGNNGGKRKVRWKNGHGLFPSENIFDENINKMSTSIKIP